MPEYQTTRGEVIEKGVSLEAGISSLIGMLLDIDVETSLSLGSKNTSLGLNSKVNLLSDLKFVPKEVIWQFQTFAEIRNKFAHVQYVDSFVKCFEILSDKKNKFIKTFGEKIEDDTDEEIKLSMCFSFLCMSLGIWLQLILRKASFNRDQDLKKTYRGFTFAVHKACSERIQPGFDTPRFCGGVGLIGLRSKIRRWHERY